MTPYALGRQGASNVSRLSSGFGADHESPLIWEKLLICVLPPINMEPDGRGPGRSFSSQRGFMPFVGVHLGGSWR